MAAGYNPYRTNKSTGSSLLDNLNSNNQSVFNNRLARLSLFGRNYQEAAIKNAKGIHANEDLTAVTDSNGYQYTLFSRKVHALMQERQTVAALSGDYYKKIAILKEYATKVEIRDFVTKMANEIIVYGKDKKFCEMMDLPNSYSEVVRKKTKDIFEKVYTLSGFGDRTAAWDAARDWLVEGFICREIIYDKKGKNVVGFQKLDPASIVPIVDPETGLKVWIQYPADEQNRRILLDVEIVYISYSGSSNYMETSYVEPLIRPYNELKNMERSKLLFNLINATMHKEFVIPTQGLSPMLAEQEVASLIADYKDHIAFDDTTGLVYIDGSKDLPYSKEYWLPNPGDARPEMNIIEPGGHDLNENNMLIWFYNAMKRASKFPFTRLDNTNGGGNVYATGGDLTYDDYNFTQYIERLRAIFKEIILKPIMLQLILEFPELEKEMRLANDLDIKYYGHSEILKAKELSNLQARSEIAANLMQNLQIMDANGNPRSVLHPKMIQKHIMEFSEEFMLENDRYWQEEPNGAPESQGGGGATPPGGGAGPGGGPEAGGGPEGGAQPAQPGQEDQGNPNDLGPEIDNTGGAQPPAQPPAQ
jgi:hypothetical protein